MRIAVTGISPDGLPKGCKNRLYSSAKGRKNRLYSSGRLSLRGGYTNQSVNSDKRTQYKSSLRTWESPPCLVEVPELKDPFAVGILVDEANSIGI